MAHYKADNTSLGSILTAYPHDPEDRSASITDYVEGQFAIGWELVSHSDGTYGMTFVFKANAQ